MDCAGRGVALADARVVVGGGRGVGGEEGFAALDELAGLLGAAVGVSRVVTSAGWRPHAQQVGQTGTKISPSSTSLVASAGRRSILRGAVVPSTSSPSTPTPRPHFWRAPTSRSWVTSASSCPLSRRRSAREDREALGVPSRASWARADSDRCHGGRSRRSRGRVGCSQV